MNVFVNLLTFACLLLSWTSFGQAGGIGADGGGPKQSWQDIYDNPNLQPRFPDFMVEDREVSYKHLCLIEGGEFVRTKYKYVISPEYDTSKEILFDYLETPRIKEIAVCSEWEDQKCISWENELFEIPLEAAIKVYLKKKDHSGDYDSDWEFAFEKPYPLDQCQ